MIANHSNKLRYGIAVLLPMIALSGEFLLWQYISTYSLLLLYPSIFLVALLAGGKPGILSTILSAAGVYLLDYGWTLNNLTLKEMIPFLIFFCMGMLVSFVALRYRIVFGKMSEIHSDFKLSKKVYRRKIKQKNMALEKVSFDLHIFQHMVENISDYAIIILDPVGIIQSWSVGAQKLTGYIKDEMIGRHFSHFYNAIDQGKKNPEFELEQAKKFGRYEVEGIRVSKDGSEIYGDIVITALRDESNELRGFGMITKDITERKRIEAQVNQVHIELEEKHLELEASNKELEAFSYSVSHDLRGPLRGIDGFSLALLEDYGKELDSQAKQYLDYIRTGVQKMGQLIDDMLNLSLITRKEMEVKSVDLSELAGDLTNGLVSQKPNRKVQFKIAEGAVAEGDPGLLNAMLENLLSNAWKFTEKNVHKAEIEFGFDVVDGKKTYFVKDNGVGFDMSYYSKLFGAFQRLHANKDFSGTGVGLATVRRIVHRHGGQIWAESKEGEGATFYFTLGD